MTRGAWAASGRRSGFRRDPRPADAWSLAVDRARRWWCELTGSSAAGPFSDVAAAAILSTAVALWSDVAAELAAARGDPEDG